MEIASLLPSLRRLVLVATAVVALLGLGAELVHHLIPGIESPLLPLLSLSEEANVPTWYSSMLLFSCGVILCAIGLAVRSTAGRFWKHWSFLGIVFVYMSLDETAQFHERLNSILPPLHGAFYFSWIIPVGIAVAVVGIAYLRFLAHLPPPTRRRFVVAGILYVGGALGMEIPLGIWTEHAGGDNLGYALIDFVEESLEMLGAALFLLALLRHWVELEQPERDRAK
jgi:hypothetical protein